MMRKTPGPRSGALPAPLSAATVRRVGGQRAVLTNPYQTGQVHPLPRGAEVLSSLLQEARTEYRAARSRANLHVSDLIYQCARMRAICETQDVAIPAKSISLMDAITYRQGDAIHDVIRERAAQGGASLVWGKWKCRCGSLRIEEPRLFSDVDRSEVCEHCETDARFYEELEFLDDELSIMGHPDLLLRLPEPQAFHVVELKSISAKAFDELVRPIPEHVVQAFFYWFLMHRKGYSLTNTVSIMYVTKGYVFRGQPFKEYLVPVDDLERRLEDYLEDARAVLAARKDASALPPRTRCPTRDAPDARTCPVAARCFAPPQSGPVARVSFLQAARGGVRK